MHQVSVNLDLDKFPLTVALRKKIRGILIARMNVVDIPIKLNEGFSLYTDKLDTLDLLVNKEYEPSETKMIKKSLKRGMIGLDIGANIGYYSILMAERCKKVYSFEPQNDNYKILKRNILLNNCENKIIPERKALANYTGRAALKINRFNNGGHSIAMKFNVLDRKAIETVDCIKLDDYFINKPNPEIIKMDVEGYEREVIQGGESVFKSAKFIAFENDAEMLRRRGQEEDSIIKIFKGWGFKIARINKSNLFAYK